MTRLEGLTLALLFVAAVLMIGWAFLHGGG